MTVQIFARKLPLARDEMASRIEAAVVAAAASKQLPPPELSVVVVGDARMRQLNRDFHDVDTTTDVLAFPLDDDFGTDSGGVFGEVIVCAPEAYRQASYRRLDPEVELLLYVIHGTLHLLGEDDHDPKEARQMRQLERSAIEMLGLFLPSDHLDELKY